MAANESDVVIVGAGPAGSVAAFFLAQAGVDVTLVEQATFPRDKICGDGISPRSVTVMAKMGLLDWAEARFPKQHVRLGAPNGAVVEVDEAFGDPPHDHAGFVIPRTIFDHALVKRAVEVGARLVEGTRAVGMEQLAPDRVRVLGECDGETVGFEASLVIAADGGLSSFTRRQGLVPEPADLVASRQYFEGIADEDPGLLEIHWEPTVLPGYGWIFHLGEGRANVGIGLYADAVRKDHVNLNELLRTFVANNPYARRVLSQAQPAGPIRGFPLRSNAHKVTPYADNLIVIGEAAGCVNPPSGEGIGPSMLGAELAVPHVRQALETGAFAAQDLAAYGRDFHAIYDPIHRSGRVAQKFLQYPWLISRMVESARRDRDLARLLSNLLRGVAPSQDLFKPKVAFSLLRGG
jgi:geranylgeranyl reductase family protein